MKAITARMLQKDLQTVERDHKVVHNLLQYLDVFKPIMIIPLQKLSSIESDLLSKIPLEETLEFWSIPIGEVQTFFDEEVVSADLLEPLITFLSFQIPQDETKICMIDLLTILCILMYGEWSDKMRLLFGWYNLNRQGLLEEQEHFLFLKRLGNILRKLKFIGALDMTDDDCSFMAVQARIVVQEKPDGGGHVGQFRPGLYFDDFLQWTESNPVCKTLFEFMRVLQRLIDTMMMLDRRSQRLFDVIEEKRLAAERSAPIPICLSALPTVESNEVYLLHRGYHDVTFSIPNLLRNKNLVGSCVEPVYAKVEKIVPFYDPFQENIPTNIIERNEDLHKSTLTPGLKTFKTVYKLTSYKEGLQSPILSAEQSPFQASCKSSARPDSRFMRVTLKHLEPGTKYNISLFTHKGHRFRKIELSTLAQAHIIEKLQSRSKSLLSELREARQHVILDDYQQVRCRLTVSPSSISQEALYALVTQKVIKADSSIIFTGSFCDMQQHVLDMIVKLKAWKRANISHKLSFQNIVALMDGLLQSQLNLNWKSNVAKFFSSFYAYYKYPQERDVNLPAISAALGERELFHFDARGPWGCSDETLHEFAQLLGVEEFEYLQKVLGYHYGVETAAIAPPRGNIKLDQYNMYLLDQEHSLATALHNRVSVDDVSEALTEKIMNIHVSAKSERSVLVVMASPVDMMDPSYYAEDNNKYIRDVNQRGKQFADVATSTPQPSKRSSMELLQKTQTISSIDEEKGGEEEEEEVEVKLRGKYELLHGEYAGKANHTQHKKAQFNASGTWSLAHQSATSSTQSQSLDFDKTFCNFVMSALSYAANISHYLKHQDDPSAIHPITLISTNWYGGSNFELHRNIDGHDVSIQHFNLLPCPNNITHEDAHDPQSTWNTARRAILVQNESLMRRIQASLPDGVEMRILPDSPLRALELSVLSDNSIYFEFLPISTVQEAALQHCSQAVAGLNIPAYLLKTPKCVRVSEQDVLIQLEAHGKGSLSCTLYEVPISMKLIEFQVAITTSYMRKDFIQCGETKVIPVFGHARSALLRFEGLQPHCMYGLLVDTDSIQKDSSLQLYTTMFCTLPSSKTQISSILFAPMSNQEYEYGASHRVMKLLDLADTYRFSSGYLVGLFCPHDADFSMNPIPRTDMNDLHQRYPFVHSQPWIAQTVKDLHQDPLCAIEHGDQSFPVEQEVLSVLTSSQRAESKVLPVPQYGNIYLLIHGIFAYIVPQFASDQCLRDVLELLRIPLLEDAGVKVVVLFSGKLLIHALFKDSSGGYVTERCLDKSKYLIIELIEEMLKWKFAQAGRECKILGAAVVGEVTTVIISRRLLAPSHTKNVFPDYDMQSVSQYSRLTGQEDLLSQGSGPKEVADEVSTALNSVQLSQLSSIFTKNGIQFIIFPLFFYKDKFNKGIYEDFFEDDTITIVSAADDGSLGSAKNPQDAQKAYLIIPEGVQMLTETLVYEILPSARSKFNGMSLTKAHVELYADLLPTLSAREPVCYQLDFLMDDIFAVPMPDPEVDYADSVASQSEYVQEHSQSSLHGVWMNAQEVVTSYDLFHIVVGPVLGKITTEEVRVLFEFNMDISSLDCMIRTTTGVSSSDRNVDFKDDASVSTRTNINCKVSQISAYTPIIFHFNNLRPDHKYEILLPQLSPHRVLGVFRTPPKFVSTTEIIFTSGNNFTNLPIVNSYFHHLQHFQSPQLGYLRIENEFINNIQTEELLAFNHTPSMWTLLAEEINSPASTASVVLHLAPQTILSLAWDKVQDAVFHLADKIPLEGGERNKLSLRYLEQLEHVIKDSITVLFATPAISRVLSSCGNILLYHSQYLLPSQTTSFAADEESAIYRYTLLVRKMFQSQVQAYISNMFGIDAEQKDQFHYWRIGTVMVAMVDSVAGRTKVRRTDGADIAVAAAAAGPPTGEDLKEEDEDDDGDDMDEDNVATEVPSVEIPSPPQMTPKRTLRPSDMAKARLDTNNAAHVFSQGFIDRSQWKAIRNVALDNTVTQLVLVFEKPLISLYGVPTNYQSPAALGRGEALPWAPTLPDLTLFFTFWIEWILKAKKQSKNLEIRSIVFVSRFAIPYSTVIQDVRTGFKLHQLCVGDYNLSCDDTDAILRPETRSFHADTYVLNGKIGTMKYVHKLKNQDYFRTESFTKDAVRAMTVANPDNRANSNNIAAGEAKTELILEKFAGIGKLKFFVDSWNPVGIWCNETMKNEHALQIDNTDDTADKEAILVIGPIVGNSIVIDHQPDMKEKSASEHVLSEDQLYVKVPIMLEVDRATSITFYVTGVLTGERLQIHAENIKANAPIVIEIGPLEKDERYLVQMVSGLKASPYNEFVIHTHVHWDETNMLVLNCELTTEMNAATVLLSDVTQRCSIPYHGVNAIVHSNFQPTFEAMIQEHRYNRTLVEGLSEYHRKGKPTNRLKREVKALLHAFREKFRDVYAKPSYRELLKAPVSHILLPQVTIPIFTDEEDVDLDNEKRMQRATRLLQLIENRVTQEYIDQLAHPGLNVFRAVGTTGKRFVGKPTEGSVEASEDLSFLDRSLRAGQDISFEAKQWLKFVNTSLALFQHGNVPDVVESKGMEEEDKPVEDKKEDPAEPLPVVTVKPKADRHIQWAFPEEDAVDAILTQWYHGCTPAPAVWLPLLSINKKVCIEVLPNINPTQICVLERLLKLFTRFIQTQHIVPHMPVLVAPKAVTAEIAEHASVEGSSVVGDESLVSSVSQDQMENDDGSIHAKGAEDIEVLSDRQYSKLHSRGSVRLLVIHGKPCNDGGEELMQGSQDSTKRLIQQLHTWKGHIVHRSFVIVYPTNKYGSRKFSLQASFTETALASDSGKVITNEVAMDYTVYTIDSLYRSNEFDRRFQMAEKEKKFLLSRKKISAAAARSKRAMKKREEEEKRQRLTMTKEIQEMMSRQIPDGYLLLQCHTVTIISEKEPEPPQIVEETKAEVNQEGDVEMNPKADNEAEAKMDVPAGDKGGTDKKEEEGEKGTAANQDVKAESKDDGVIESSDKKQAEDGEPKEEQEDAGPPPPPPEPVNPYAHIDLFTSMKVEVLGDKVATEMQATGEMPSLDEDVANNANNFSNQEKFKLLQLPTWIIQLVMPSDSVFVQDEVLLFMRQSSKTKKILDRIEGGEFVPAFIRLYESSRLSELSRPEDLREVDLSIDGLIPMFFKDLVNKIWEEGIPAEVKHRMLDITDSFVRSYCFSRAMPTMDVLSSAAAFAQAVNYAMIVSIALKTARRLSRNAKYAYLMEKPDSATLEVLAIEDEEVRLRKLKEEEAIMQAEVAGMERLIERIKSIGVTVQQKKKGVKTMELEEEKRKADEERMRQEILGVEVTEAVEKYYDSDIEDLEKEQAQDEANEEAKLEEEERKLDAAERGEDNDTEDITKKAFEAEAAKEKEAKMDADELLKMNQVRNEMAASVVNIIMEELSEEAMDDVLKEISPILRAASVTYHPPQLSREEKRQAAEKHVARLREYREKFRMQLGPRFIHMA